ncbi:FullMastoparan-VT3 [Vespula maculifrons]|uniref:FullMastoparan-VT3 n=1 Tax=Vespula maculifrons TaxID=7453 RepID=A0ABD2BK08_VESMC
MKSTILILFAAFIALLGFFGMNAEAAANPSADALAGPSADANAEAINSNIKQNYITGMKSLILLLIVVITMTFSKVNCVPITQPRAESWNIADLCEKFKKPGQSPPIICF